MTADGNLEKRIKAYSITEKNSGRVLFALGTIMQTCKLWTWKEELNDIKITFGCQTGCEEIYS